MRGEGFGLAVGLAVAVGLGGLVFMQLSSGRERAQEERLTDANRTAPPIGSEVTPPPPNIFAQAGTPIEMLVADPQPPPVTPAQEAALVPTAPAAPASMTDETQRLRSPTLIVDLSEAAGTPPAQAPVGPGGMMPDAAALAAAAGGRTTRDGQTLSSNERFAAQFGLGEENRPARAQRMTNPESIVPQGAVIPAVLETAINSDLPGFVRAVVSRDVRSFDGRTVLIPRGSRLVGQYRSGVALGQSRAFVIWTRLIRPDGAFVDLASPTTDALGRGGLEGRVDRHFLTRFGGAILLSLISAGARSVNDDDDRVIIDSTRGVEDATALVLERDLDVSPTISVAQGAPIRIFVSRDLDFSAVGP
jgi:type IV secretion system protein VirB10